MKHIPPRFRQQYMKALRTHLDQGTVMFRVAQEALTNVECHAAAAKVKSASGTSPTTSS